MDSNMTTVVPSNMTSRASSVSPFTLDFQIGLSVFAALLFVLSLVCNTVVIYIVCTRSHMRNSTNILIANMAVGDLLLTVAIPYIVKWMYVGSTWFSDDFFGVFLCKFLNSAQIGSITCSVFTLVTISIDRCLAITYPLKHVFSDKVLKLSIAGIWISAVGMSVPMIIVVQVKETENGNYICIESWGKFSGLDEEKYILTFSTCTYFVPLVLIAIAYTITGIRLWKRKLPGNQNLLAQQKIHAASKKATIMLITVVLVFALCWLPLQIREVLKFYEHLQIPSKLDIVLPWVGLSNIAINPFLYVIFSENYRTEFLEILCCHHSQKMDVYHGLLSVPERTTPLGTPMLSRRSTQRISLSPNNDRRQLSLSNHSLQMKKLNGK
ncbi:RYamide receptor-like [Actinia tenebrosa]|uniref:RYamide receptor-like n=1 Tax=Actinia tenebrosa TaxID=6105 RepID=A0A6P8HRE1_ACTTE|nr:RYamide receptor-like [Actinia tenebrosa]XP_031555200.1 RYamide receptor-like [Actinia tenebrosa]